MSPKLSIKLFFEDVPGINPGIVNGIIPKIVSGIVPKFSQNFPRNCPRNFPCNCPRNRSRNCLWNCPEIVSEIVPEIVPKFTSGIVPDIVPEIVPEIISLEIRIIFYLFLISDYLTDPSDSDDADMFTSQATQGYSEGLARPWADNKLESEVSSFFWSAPFSTYPICLCISWQIEY